MPNVTFPCAALIDADTGRIAIYYGGADTVVCLVFTYLNHAIDEKNGGFYGFIAADLTIPPDAPKVLIQNSRLLWTFAHAYRRLDRPEYRRVADRAYDYLLTHFWDDKFGGLFWLLDVYGRPQDTTKWVYGQAFGIPHNPTPMTLPENRGNLAKHRHFLL